jgi:hypothetical protein
MPGSTWTPPPDEPATSERWASAEFRAELAAWVGEQGAATGAVRALEPVKQRPWSTGWRVEADAGTFSPSRNCPQQNFEAALVTRPAPLSPRRMCRRWPSTD